MTSPREFIRGRNWSEEEDYIPVGSHKVWRFAQKVCPITVAPFVHGRKELGYQPVITLLRLLRPWLSNVSQSVSLLCA